MVHTMSDAAIEKRRKELQALEAASQRVIQVAPKQPEAARKLAREEAPAPKIDSPSRDDSIIDVKAKEIE